MVSSTDIEEPDLGFDGPESGQWTMRDRMHQTMAASVYALRPKRLSLLPIMIRSLAAHHLTARSLRQPVPDPRQMPGRTDGFAGISTELSSATLIRAYRSGLFQMSHAAPFKWWSPDRRMVLFPDQLHLEKGLKRKLKQGRYSITFDRAFGNVVHQCAGPREKRRVQLTWLMPDVIEVFQDLHMLGHAHSVEVWDEGGNLAGGLFGTCLGKLFMTESQFSLQRDASKIAFAVLNRHLQHWGFMLNDVRLWSSHLERFGCELLPREDHLAMVDRFGAETTVRADWKPVDDLSTGVWDPKQESGWTRGQVFEELGLANHIVHSGSENTEDVHVRAA